MTHTQFSAICALLRNVPSLGRVGARMVLVDGLTLSQAAKSVGCNKSNVWAAVQRIRKIERKVSQVPTAQV
jgi:DNA-directed RNA polymerase specialized sigma24 family protein